MKNINPLAGRISWLAGFITVMTAIFSNSGQDAAVWLIFALLLMSLAVFVQLRKDDSK